MLEQKRQLIYYVAVSIDHYIAHEDGSVGGFLETGKHIHDYFKSLRDFDTVIMGKNTYEFGYQYGVQPGDPSPVYGTMMHYIFSQSMELYRNAQVHVIRDDPAEFVRELKQQDGQDIYLCGGGQLAGHLLKAELVDTIILKINPIVLGAGIPVFGKTGQDFGLTLNDAKVYPNGVLFVNYAVDYTTLN